MCINYTIDLLTSFKALRHSFIFQDAMINVISLFVVFIIGLLIKSTQLLALKCSYQSMVTGAPKSARVVIFGATGYIGKFVVKEALNRNFDTVAVVRPGYKLNTDYLDGATVIESDISDEKALISDVFFKPADIVISCLASRSGVEDDAYLIDYQATLNTLNAAINSSKTAHLNQFIQLSALCVQKPRLHFQRAKLKLEAALQLAKEKGHLDKYSIVRPTAYFKSLSGQFELLQKVCTILRMVWWLLSFMYLPVMHRVGRLSCSGMATSVVATPSPNPTWRRSCWTAPRTAPSGTECSTWAAVGRRSRCGSKESSCSRQAHPSHPWAMLLRYADASYSMAVL